jgi:hypothetical protein
LLVGGISNYDFRQRFSCQVFKIFSIPSYGRDNHLLGEQAFNYTSTKTTARTNY